MPIDQESVTDIMKDNREMWRYHLSLQTMKPVEVKFQLWLKDTGFCAHFLNLLWFMLIFITFSSYFHFPLSSTLLLLFVQLLLIFIIDCICWVQLFPELLQFSMWTNYDNQSITTNWRKSSDVIKSIKPFVDISRLPELKWGQENENKTIGH